jgi:hypothetical protein
MECLWCVAGFAVGVVLTPTLTLSWLLITLRALMPVLTSLFKSGYQDFDVIARLHALYQKTKVPFALYKVNAAVSVAVVCMLFAASVWLDQWRYVGVAALAGHVIAQTVVMNVLISVAAYGIFTDWIAIISSPSFVTFAVTLISAKNKRDVEQAALTAVRSSRK